MGFTKMKLTALMLIIGCAVGTGTSVTLMSQADEPTTPTQPSTDKAKVSPLKVIKDQELDSVTAFPELKIVKDVEDLRKQCPLIFTKPIANPKTDSVSTQLRKHQLISEQYCLKHCLVFLSLDDVNPSYLAHSER